ncbi:Ubiquitin carboxyl-terminal hydrolase [Quillaja saponaria]|uniref:Ubiquitin carboxyl-terminal hydrolase n=1 Tax=Quillaja saponaria TaxID=32244 RepID=A0AAD7L3C1_QUISA|nr:Ubiquitin carboxyl-terminal hydrolase [Quillaja saponaria]
MEHKCCIASTSCNSNRTRRFIRDRRPAHYLLKIQSYSLLFNDTEVENYESGVFDAGGYKWRLALYRSGKKVKNESKQDNDHISLHLIIEEVDTLSLDTIEEERRFSAMKTEWGIAEFLSLNTLKDASNGYLVDDCCVFGAEVSVVQCTGKGECHSMIELEGPINSTYTWRIQDFAAVDKDTNVDSEKFTVGGRKWKLEIYPKGYSTQKSKSVSIFLHLDDLESLQQKRKLYAEYKFCIKDQLRNNHHEKKASNRFSATSNNWGFPSFISLVSLKDASKGYIMSGTLIVEVQFIKLSTIEEYNS